MMMSGMAKKREGPRIPISEFNMEGVAPSSPGIPDPRHMTVDRLIEMMDESGPIDRLTRTAAVCSGPVEWVEGEKVAVDITFPKTFRIVVRQLVSAFGGESERDHLSTFVRQMVMLGLLATVNYYGFKTPGDATSAMVKLLDKAGFNVVHEEVK